MSDDRQFERNARAWLELGPTNIPPRVIADALSAIETTPQERGLRVPWKDLRMTIPMRLATAAVIGALAIGGGLLFVGGRLPSTGHPNPSPVPTAALPAGPPWLVFQSPGIPQGTGNEPAQLWAVKPDGSGLHVLADGMAVASGWSFDISPDGSKVAFQTDLDRVWETPIAGGAATLLSADCPVSLCAELEPAYSPDGLRIVFARFDTNRGSVVAIRDLATGAMTRIERTATQNIDGFSMRPSWSPDGRSFAIAWTPDHVENKLHAHIAVVSVDGTSFVEFPWPDGATFAGRPDWSPDGSRILFTTSLRDAFGQAEPPGRSGPWIYTVRPDGTDLQVACPDCSDDVRYASWTPDGKHILVWDRRSWALMDPDGGNRTFINEAALTFSGLQGGPGSIARLQPTR